MASRKQRTLTLTFDSRLRAYLPKPLQRLRGGQFSQAVSRVMRELIDNLDGLIVSMSIEGEAVKVVWEQSPTGQQTIQPIVGMLKKGRYSDAILLMELLLSDDPGNSDYLYNLGMAYSDLGALERSISLLEKLIELEPAHTNGRVALGVALSRSGKLEESAAQLETALSQASDNPWAHRNLGAVLGKLGRLDEAVDHLLIAVAINPEDQAAWFGLAQALEKTDKSNEADKAYLKAIDLDEFSEIAELARQARSKIADKNFRSVTPNMERMDAVMYCLGALEKFENMPLDEVQKIGVEIAILGTHGININDPTQQYGLRSLPGKFSGLHLLCLEYVAFKKFAPDKDIGFDLSAEYNSALGLFERKKKAN